MMLDVRLVTLVVQKRDTWHLTCSLELSETDVKNDGRIGIGRWADEHKEREEENLLRSSYVKKKNLLWKADISGWVRTENTSVYEWSV